MYGEWGEGMPTDIPKSLVPDIVDYFLNVSFRQAVLDKVVEELDSKAEEYILKNKDKIIETHKTEKLKENLEKRIGKINEN